MIADIDCFLMTSFAISRIKRLLISAADYH